MAENKKSFVAYCEWQETLEELSDEDAGKLIKHIFKYVNDENPETDSQVVKLCFIPIKQTLKRDLKKYEQYIDKQKSNGAKGGRPKKTQKTQAFTEKPKKADSVNVSVSVSDNVSDNDIYKKQILNDLQYLEVAAMQNKISIEKVKDFVEQFNRHLVLTAEKKTIYKDYQSHFANWLRTQKGKEPKKKKFINPCY